jgi:FkbM family methyltransferase
MQLKIAKDHFIVDCYFPNFDIVMSNHINKFGFWENIESKIIAGALPEGGVFLNIRSNVGYHLVSTKLRRPDCRVIGVEPHPYMLAISNLNARVANLEIEVLPYAIGKIEGAHMLYTSSYNSGDSRLNNFNGALDRNIIDVITGEKLFAWTCAKFTRHFGLDNTNDCFDVVARS